MHLGVQYYRPPFPQSRHWKDDLARIRASGLDTLQLWVVWGWVEPSPGEFAFDDYDRLVELAGHEGLSVVLSTIAAVQPYWIHRVVPGSEMVDHRGNRVISSNRGECHFGLTPGGCIDHPGVWERMSSFLTEVVKRYHGAENLVGWDAWNELRWNVQADGLVCFCEHTVRAFREWLDQHYGGLDGLNAAWLRRYQSWEDVFPGKLPNRPYTEMMAFEHFLTWRANRHGRQRYQLMKALDPDHPVTVHAAHPCPLIVGDTENHAVNRGNDWFYADDCDGVGCSSFPKWFGMDDADLSVRVEYVSSAARDKLVWLSEVQGGRSSLGFEVYPPVDALSQQRWIWNGLACGADTILFWCWRDEVFGRESAGFGLAGGDGLAEERLEAMAKTGLLLREHASLLEGYQPARAEIGVLFSPETHYLHWAQDGTAQRAADALQGYCRALVKRSLPYRVIEEEHLDELAGLRLLFMPRTLVVDDGTAERIGAWVRGGGTLVCESECGAFGSNGIYRYPEDRFLSELAGAKEIGRRSLTSDSISAIVEGRHLQLPAIQWVTPWHVERGDVYGAHPDGALVARVPVGRGQVVLLGSYHGECYAHAYNRDFEALVEWIAGQAGVGRPVRILAPEADENRFMYVRWGQSGQTPIIFVFFPEGVDSCELVFDGLLDGNEAVRDLISGGSHTLEVSGDIVVLSLPCPTWRLAVLVPESACS
jgi:beta-galactosidase